MAGNYVFTPARRAALEKARRASAYNRKGKSRRIYGQSKNRPTGIQGLKRNTIPYARANKRSQTLGFNAGTIIPGTKKRIVIGGYARLESTVRKTAVDRAVDKAAYKYLGKGTKRSKVGKYIRKNASITAPAVRVRIAGAETRLGTSRGAGPTVIIRRGKHPTPVNKTRTGLKRYDQASAVRKKKGKSRKQRRKSS